MKAQHVSSPRTARGDPSPDRVATRADAAAPVLEVFASIQGEGLYVGQPQVFLRLFGCPLRCRWCDTPGSWHAPAETTDGAHAIARVRGSHGTQDEPAWATPFQATCWIAAVEPGAPRTVSVTGGEPLVWPEFLLGLRPLVGARRLHLETAGAHPLALERVIDAFDHVSLDLKPDFDLDPPVELRPVHEPSPRTSEEWVRVRERCLELVRGRDACAKLVVSGDHAPERYRPILDEVACSAPELPVVLQPVTPMGGVRPISGAGIEALVEIARELGLDARVLPQVHRALRIP